MRWPKRESLRCQIAKTLADHSSRVRALPGISDPRAVDTLATQILASLRREDYYRIVQAKPVSSKRADPNDKAFDAERAVAYHVRQGNVDEAAWLLFLMTYFARPGDTRWLRLRDVYGELGCGVWDWRRVSANPGAFAQWLSSNWQRIRGKFGNHRKYETLRPDSARNMAIVVSDYVQWIGNRGHTAFLADKIARGSNDLFDLLYREMAVTSFGRLAKFDYLMLLARYGIANVEPSSAYLESATGPRAGALLLFTGSRKKRVPAATLQRMVDDLDAGLQVGMAVLEDALCNWQKEPLTFVHFRG